MTAAAPSVDPTPPGLPTVLTWSTELGKRVRTGSWSEQAVSTSQQIREAIRLQKWELAAELVDYFLEEAKVCHVIYRSWSAGFETWLTEQGVEQVELAPLQAATVGVLAFPDGRPFVPGVAWDDLCRDAGLLSGRLRGLSLEGGEAIEAFEALKESWRQLHDRWVDWMSAQLTFVADRFGEEALGSCYRAVLAPYLDERYAPFDLRQKSWDETLLRNLYLSFEAMRGHLCGPDRDGDIEFEEHPDRWVLRFDPCGSGNRGLRGDSVEGTGSRAEAPYGYGVTVGEHDWAWNERGVCYYCAHCCFALERWPAEQWGHPVRVVDSPLYPAEVTGETPAKCSWTIYRSIEAIPESAYRRIGLTKPA